ncbi:hypothetical protein ES703_89166 [subsurface metagenome]
MNNISGSPVLVVKNRPLVTGLRIQGPFGRRRAYQAVGVGLQDHYTPQMTRIEGNAPRGHLGAFLELAP